MPTLRQTQVLTLIAAGATNKDMIAELGVSDSSVRKHVTVLMRKYGVHTRAALIRAAIAAGDLHAATSYPERPA